MLLLSLGAGSQPTQAQGVEPILSLDPAQAYAGAIVLVDGRGFGPGGGELTFFWDGEQSATHPMELGETFSIPFPVPADANPGDHRIDVCTDNPCGSTDLTKKATAVLHVAGAMPRFSATIAYIYRTDKTLAAEFSSLLSRAGFEVVPIELNDVAQTDFATFPLVVVGSDTSIDGQWGTADQVSALKRASRIVGIGEGGYRYFGVSELMIGAPNGVAAPGQHVLLGDTRLTSGRIPFDLSTFSRNQRQIPLFSQPVGAVAIDLSNQPTAIVPHAFLDDGQKEGTAGVIVGQGCRTLWGFNGSPKTMTSLGQALFINTIVFALGNNCSISQTVPCGQLVNEADTPGSASIDFDDLDSNVEIADFYAGGYGVRFEQSSTNRATIDGGHVNDPSLPRSKPNTAANSAIYPATSDNVPFSIFFERDQAYAGMWIGNGEDGKGNPGNLTATLTAFDREGNQLCLVRTNPVPVSHTTFLGLTDGFGRIARLELDYGRTFNPESIDNLVFGPFAPANNIRVCHLQVDGCPPASNARVVIVRNGVPIAPPTKTDNQGYVSPRSQVAFGDMLWVTYPVSTTTRTTLYHTNGAPRRVRALDFNHFANQEMSVTVGAANPLLVYNLTVSTQWSMVGDAAYQNRLRAYIQKTANYLYDFSDGQMSLGNVDIYQNYDMWDEADVRIYASNNLRPHAEIGGVSEVDMPDPLIGGVTYYPGYTFMGRTWNRFNLPGEPANLGVDVSNDWPLALAHEMGHYLLYLFDTYLAVAANGEIVETKNCTGSAMGWVYNESNTEFIFHTGHWDSACGDTVANQTLKRTEWQTILLWYGSLFAPSVVNAGPPAPPVSVTGVTIHPPSNAAVVLPNQTFSLAYQGGETASGEARAFVIRDKRVIDQGKPTEGTTEIKLIGSQTGDRFCVFDVNDFTDDASAPRHQYGCEVLAVGDNSLQMEKDNNWAPIIEVSYAASRTIGISVTQEISSELSLRAVLYPEDTDTPTEILLTADGNLHTGTFHSPVDATAAYVQVYVDEAADETNPRRETLVDYGVGGSGAGGPTSMFGGVPIVSSDGKAEYARKSDVFLARGEFIALQSMAGTPRPPQGRQVLGQSYRLVAYPTTLAGEGHVALHIRPPRGLDRAVQEFPKVVIAYWNNKVWTPLASINLDDLIDGRIAIAPSKGVGIYALLLDVETEPTKQLYLPQIER